MENDEDGPLTDCYTTTLRIDDYLHDFLIRLPKVELHAHLNGCIRESTLHDLARERQVILSPRLFCSSQCIPAAAKDHIREFRELRGPSFYNRQPRNLTDCFDVFTEIPKCVNDLPSLRRITHEALHDFWDHNCIYLELRSTPKILLRTHGETEKCTKRDYVATIVDMMRSFEQETHDPAQSRQFPLRCRLIISIDRSQSLEEARENVLAIDFFRKRNYVVGVDVSGNPLKGNIQDLLPALQEARNEGLMVTFHCAEVSRCLIGPCTVVDANDDDDEVTTILNFRPDRLGHALLLSPQSHQRLLKLGIPVEICPTSNVMTLELAHRYQGCTQNGLLHHPQLSSWLENHHPISICTDDPGVFHTNLTQEWQLLAIAYQLSTNRIKDIMIQSSACAFCDEQLKLEIQQLIHQTDA